MFSARQSKMRRATSLTACKAWWSWKNKLVTDFMKVQETPFEKYPRIEEDAWDEFMPLKTSDEFTKRSEAASKLIKSSSCPHKMGTNGYVGMSKI
jgi:hypothetical protein